MYYVEGYATCVKVEKKSVKNQDNQSNNGNSQTLFEDENNIIKFNFKSDWVGACDESLYAEIIEKLNASDDNLFRKNNGEYVKNYINYDSESCVFTLGFAVDSFISKCSCHFGIYFDIIKEKEFVVKSFLIL